MASSDPGFKAAYDEAKRGLHEGGVPIGAALVDKHGNIMGKGHNMRIQEGSAVLHAEMAALEDAGRLPGSAYKGATMYTTLSPCDMCSGACLMYGVKRVVMGEQKNFQGPHDYLKSRGIELVDLDNDECKAMMSKYIKENPKDWFEDIGDEPPK